LMLASETILFRDGLLQDQVAVITGAGWGGIGSAVAIMMGKLGASLAFCGRRLEPLQETEAELKKCGILSVFYEQCDIRDSASVESFLRKVLQRFSRINILINNAGGQFPIRAEHLNEKGYLILKLISVFLIPFSSVSLQSFEIILLEPGI